MDYQLLDDNILRIVAFLKNTMESNFTFCKMLDCSISSLPAVFHVRGLGAIPIPISLSDAERLKETAIPSTFGHGLHAVMNPLMHSSWYIKGEQITIPSDSHNLSSITEPWMEEALKQSNIDVSAIGAEARLAQMVLYVSRGHFVRHRSLVQESGHFATLVLQIPVEGGYEDGNLNIGHHQKSYAIDTSFNSHKCFYVTVYHIDSQLEMSPISKGCKIELVYHLVWKSPAAVAMYPTLPDISSFLVALTKIKKELRGWIGQSPNSGSYKMLVVGLEHKYDHNSYSFSTLEGQDRSVAHLMRCTGMLEVYLACLTRKVSSLAKFAENEGSELRWRRSKMDKTLVICEKKHTVHTASHWMGVDNCAVQFLELDIDVESQFVGEVFKPDVKPDKEESVAHADGTHATITSWYHQTVLVFWPKNKSIYFDLRHRFDFLLERMECKLEPKPLEMLKKVLLEPIAWTVTPFRACRLLNLCLSLKASQEALHLLQIMVDNSIGIPSNEAACLIADVECSLLGWSKCKDVVGKLVLTNPKEQLGHSAVLSLEFLERNALTAFITVANQVWDLLLTFLWGTPSLKRPILVACVYMLIRMEEKVESRDPERLSTFITRFSQWDAWDQCHLVIDVEMECHKSQPGKNLLLGLCYHAAQSVENSDEVLENCVVDLVGCFKRLDPHEPSILNFFVDKLCQPVEKPGVNILLPKIVASLDFLKLPNEIMKWLLSSRISELKSLIPPVFTWEQNEAQFPGAQDYPEVQAFLRSGERLLTLSCVFSDFLSAKNFVDEYFGSMDTCLKQGYSAMAEPVKSRKGTRCRIVKSRHLFMAQTANYQKRIEELNRLLGVSAELGFQPLDQSSATDGSNNIQEFATSSGNSVVKIICNYEAVFDTPQKSKVTYRKATKRKA